MADLRHVDVWIFDLDNTLYPASCRLFELIDARMTDFIGELLSVDQPEARTIQKDYYVRYGTTMSGLMKEHHVCADEFMEFVHDIDLARIGRDEKLIEEIAALPGKRYIFTNGSQTHAANVAGKLGLAHLFDDVFDIKSADFRPKPHRETYERFLSHHAVSATSAAMFEDLTVNLEAPAALGMTTVLVCSDADWISDEPAAKRPARLGDGGPHIHHETCDLAEFLRGAAHQGQSVREGIL